MRNRRNPMTVKELIDQLRQFPPDMLVIKSRRGEYVPRWDTMDGHWWQEVEVVRGETPVNGVYYREPFRGEEEEGTNIITALEL
jgi:hypothetical protein